MDSLTDEQKKEYLDNRPMELKTVKIQKSKLRQRVSFSLLITMGGLNFTCSNNIFCDFDGEVMLLVQVQRAEKSKPSTSSGILASVWKFHREDDEEEPNSHLQP